MASLDLSLFEPYFTTEAGYEKGVKKKQKLKV